MAAWLKLGDETVAFEHDVVPREALQKFVAFEALETLARRQAETILEDAGAEACDIADKARADAVSVTRLGYAQGRRDGLRHWHAKALLQRAEAAARHGSLREQLAGMVAQATARLVQGPVLDQYLAQALRALDDMAAQDLVLSVTLHPGDRATAQAAIDLLQPHWRDGCVVKLIEAESAEPGTCRCESAHGYVDASLSVQLATLRQAAMGALAGLQLPDDVLQPPPEAAAPVAVFDPDAATVHPGQAMRRGQPSPMSMSFPEYGNPGFGGPYDDGDDGFEDDDDENDEYDGDGDEGGGFPGPAVPGAGGKPRW
jgi:type III secretion protein L